MSLVETLIAGAVARRARPTSGLASPTGWLLDFFGGGASSSGRRVTQDTALSVSAVYAAVRLVSETCATLPLRVYRDRPDRGKDADRSHPVARLLGRQPNAWQTHVDFRAMLQAHVELRGNAYAKKLTSRAGAVTALLPMHPDRVRVLVAPDGTLWYEWRPVYPGGVVGEVEVLHQDEVVHRRGLSLDGYLGLSTLALARETIGTALASEEYAGRYFANSAQPGGVLEHPNKLSKDAYDRLRDSWAARHQGGANAHKPAILEEGMKWSQLALSNADSQFLESRKFTVTEIARWFNVPPHMIADLDRATFSNIEQQSLELVIFSMTPRLARAEAEYERDLLLAGERDTVTVKHIVNGLLRGDFKTRQDGYATARQWGWLSVNEIRELEDMNPVADGDVYLQPLNMVPAGTDPLADTGAPGGDAPPTDPPAAAGRAARRADRGTVHQRSLVVRMRLARAARAVFADGAARAVRREVEAARRMLKRAAELPDVVGVAATVAAWQPEWLAEHRAFVERALGPAVRMLAESTFGEAAWEVQAGDVGPDLDTYAADYTGGLAAREARISEALAEAITGATDVAGAVAALEARLAAWEADRAAALAARETVQLSAAAARAVWRTAGVPAIRLVADGTCAVGTALDGRVVPIGAALVAAGEAIRLADGTTWTADRALAHPPFGDGCRCGVAPAYTLPES